MSWWRTAFVRVGMALSVVLGPTACKTQNEVVARLYSGGSDGLDGGFGTPGSERCEPGNYSGSIFTTKRDGGMPVQYSGTIDFRLTQSLSGEFVVLDDKSQLQGKGMDGSTFVADIVGGSECSEGTFKTVLQNGMYTAFTSADMSTTATITFDGSITGTYVAEYLGFIGGWSTSLHLGGNYGDFVVTGNWSATHSE